MSNEPLKIIVGADIKEAEAGLKVVQAELGKTAIAAQKADSSLDGIGNGFDGVGAKSKQAATSMDGLSKTTSKALADILLLSSDGLNTLYSVAAAFEGLGSQLLQGGILIAIPIIIAGLSELGDALFGVSQQQKAFNDVLESSSKSFIEANTAISELRIQGELLSKGIGDQDAFLKHYNETLGKTIGETDNLATAEKNLVKFGDKYIQLMFLKAVANNAFAKSGQLVFESLALQQQGGDIPEWALKIRLKELQEQIQILNNLAVNAQKLAAVVSNDLPQKVGAGLSGLNGGKGFDVDVDVKIVPKVKIKKQDVKDFEYKYKASLADSITSENTKEPFEPEIVIKSHLKFENPFEEIQKNAIATNEIIKKSFISSFQSIGESIADAVSGKGNIFGNIFSGIFKALGAGLKQLGAFAIATSKLIIGLKASIGTSLGIAGGIALIALGSVISAAASKLTPKFAIGTRGAPGGSTLVGERGPELLTLPRGASITPNAQLRASNPFEALGTLQFEIQGTKLVTVLNRAQAQNSRNAW